MLPNQCENCPSSLRQPIHGVYTELAFCGRIKREKIPSQNRPALGIMDGTTGEHRLDFFVCLTLILFMMVNPFLRYFIAILLKWGIPWARVKKDYTLEPKVSVLMPTFNEGRQAYD